MIVPQIHDLLRVGQDLRHVFSLGLFLLLLDLIKDGFDQLLPFSTTELLRQQLSRSSI